MRELLNLIRRFRSDDRGAFMVIFGLLALVLVATSGAVIDFTTIEQARARAQDALDSATLGLQPTIYDNGVDSTTISAQALQLVNERLGDTNITASIEGVTIDTAAGMLRLRAQINVPTVFVALVGVTSITANVISEATRGTGANIEVALVLDVTGSMGGSKISTLQTATNNLIDTVVKDDQSTAYSKIAIVPFSMGVNVGDHFDAELSTSTTIADVRGPERGATAITAAAWRETPSTRTISAINKANPTRITTSAPHGLATNDVVYLSGISGSSAFTNLNNRWYRITVSNATRFTLTGVSTSGASGSYTGSSGTVTIWPSARMASAISKANPGVVTTTAAHNLVDGDAVYFTATAGGSSFTDMNDNWYCVDQISSTTFRLQDHTCSNINTSGWSGSYTANTAVIRKCLTNECEVVVTSNNHGLTTNDWVYVTGVGGMTQINNDDEGHPTNTATVLTSSTFELEDSDGLSTSDYTSGGQAQCAMPGCRYYYFESDYRRFDYSTWSWVNDWYMWEMDDECVSERIGANEYTDAAPATTWIGRVYLPGGSSCLQNTIVPLSSNKTALHAATNSLTASGSTAGQIGLAWGWYLLAPNFANLWPTASQPGAYDDDEVVKVVVFMTDGEFNTAYCNGVLSQESNGSSSSQINCDATNGDPDDQALSLCAGMKAPGVGIEVYTVAFQVSSSSIREMLEDCATDDDHYFNASSNQDLIDAFAEIGGFISDLRLAQ